MADLNTALIAFIGVLAGGYLNNFLGEDYRSFRDSQALAAALAGELDSHASAVKILRPGLDNMLEHIKKGNKLALPEFPPPPSPVFEALVEKIGLLGPDLAREVAYVYEQIRAFRITLHQVSKYHLEMSENWRAVMVQNATDRINSATEKGEVLVKNLDAHARSKYRHHSKIGPFAVGATLLVIVLIGAFAVKQLAGASEPSTQCTTTLDHGALHTSCK